MNIARTYFEKKHYVDLAPEFRRLMAYCDENHLRMTFHDDTSFIGIRVYDPDGDAITAFSNYTLYYDTMKRKVFFLDRESWDDGMNTMSKEIDKIAYKADETLILSLGKGIIKP